MSKWTDRALAALRRDHQLHIVPMVPKVSKADPVASFGTIGAIGTGVPGSEDSLQAKWTDQALVALHREHQLDIVPIVPKVSKADPVVIGDGSEFEDRLEKRRAHLEFDAGLPRSWAEPFARLLCSGPPGDFDPARWQQVTDAALIFCDQWAAKAHALGWKLDEVIGMDPIAPAARHDRKGLVPSFRARRPRCRDRRRRRRCPDGSRVETTILPQCQSLRGGSAVGIEV
jgi:hypothetical protein